MSGDAGTVTSGLDAERLFRLQTPSAMYRAIDRQAATIERLQTELAAARPVLTAARAWAASRHTHASAYRHELKTALETAVYAFEASTQGQSSS